jgi:hypothetical protein
VLSLVGQQSELVVPESLVWVRLVRPAERLEPMAQQKPGVRVGWWAEPERRMQAAAGES